MRSLRKSPPSWAWSLLLLSLSSLGLSCDQAATPPPYQRGHFAYQGLDREYLLYLPDSLAPQAPLIMVLHGFTSSAERIMTYSRLSTWAGAYGFAVVYPQGTTDDEGRTFWQVGYDFHAGIDRDDTGFLVALARHLQATHGLSAGHTFLTGMSNGGDMCYRLACLQPEVFRAVAPVAGVMMTSLRAQCTPDPSLPLMAVFGTADTISRYAGDPTNQDGWGAYEPTPATVAFWTAGDSLYQTDTLPRRSPEGDSFVVRYQYGAPGQPGTYLYYEVAGGGHDWPGAWGNMDFDASAEICRFFAQYLEG